MAKSLKEALLEQMATLQERGLAPGELPAEQEEIPSYSNYEDEGDRRAFGGDRDFDGRRGGKLARGRKPSGVRPREQREQREQRGHRERRETRPSRESAEIAASLVGPPPMPVQRPMRPAGPMMRPGGPGGSGGPGGPDRLAGPPPAIRPANRSDMLRRNAERIQRDQADRDQLRQLLGGFSGEELDDAGLEKFFSQLTVETGALPPLNVVLEASRNAATADPVEIGNQVRLYYRRSRAKVAPRPVAVGQ